MGQSTTVAFFLLMGTGFAPDIFIFIYIDMAHSGARGRGDRSYHTHPFHTCIYLCICMYTYIHICIQILFTCDASSAPFFHTHMYISGLRVVN